MSVAAPTVGGVNEAGQSTLARIVRRNGWTIALYLMLAALLVLARVLRPTYGPADLQSLAIGVLPIIFAAAAQTVAVISGGIDLSVGPVMAFTSVTAAALMKDSSDGFALGVVVFVLLLGVLVGTINGSLIVLSRVPDIIVTLAMSFVWAGAALLVLNSPGGGAARWFKDLATGPVVVDWFPKALLLVLICVARGLAARCVGRSWACPCMPSAAIGWPRCGAAWT